MNFKISLFFLIYSISVFSPAFAATKVVDFKPNTEITQTKSGYCWTHAISSSKKNAWRCMVGNAISDPCFFDHPSQLMICDQNPLTSKSGFILKLTKPLPNSEKVVTQENQYWIIQLANKEICSPYTGTVPGTDKEMVTYGCGNPNVSKVKKHPKKCSSGLLDGSIKKGTTWTATEVTICRSPQATTGLEIVKRQEVNIIKVWQ